eukprot:TRINITY_DN2324_c0_g1_i2.p1 TRINITY_DN2324_c0_g1~~TRINITY_DN2324_c0_g1_i2.p1  ORF type:complete len:237 (-),score=44.00 TRINITY_DN2324_c0_g1_i2:293-940(-)
MSNQDKYGFNVARFVNIKQSELEESDRFCPDCWHVLECCLCQSIQNVYIHFRNNIYIYMHHREYGRGSNTAKFFSMVTNAKLVICGHPDQEPAFLNEIQQNIDNTFILYPHQNSFTYSEIVEAANASIKEGEMNDSTTNITPSYNIVVLDGTWTQVKRMGKRLPELKYIRLEKVKETISRMRKQSSKDRVTTYEAIALLLEVCTFANEIVEISLI